VNVGATGPNASVINGASPLTDLGCRLNVAAPFTSAPSPLSARATLSIVPTSSVAVFDPANAGALAIPARVSASSCAARSATTRRTTFRPRPTRRTLTLTIGAPYRAVPPNIGDASVTARPTGASITWHADVSTR
jgi:hypothetical protein